MCLNSLLFDFGGSSDERTKISYFKNRKIKCLDLKIGDQNYGFKIIGGPKLQFSILKKYILAFI